MKTHIFFLKDDVEFFSSLTPEDKAFYISLDLDIENYDKKTGMVKQFETLDAMKEFVGLLGSDVIANVQKGLGLCLLIFNE